MPQQGPPPSIPKPAANAPDEGSPAQSPSPSSCQPPLPTRINCGRWLGLVFWTALVACAYALYIGAIKIPERYRPYNPWATLDVVAEPNFLTAYKLARTRSDPTLCLQALAQTGMAYEALPNSVTGPGCGLENAVRLLSAGVRFGAPLPLSCPLALSFGMWERHALQPAAQRRFDQRVVAIEHLGSYACRNVNTGEGAAPINAANAGRKRSRHATANALDVTALVLADGRRIAVARDWGRTARASATSGAVSATTAPAALTPEAGLLEDAHTGACRFFKGVLGPNYNAVHHDHFHLETGGYGMCR